MILQCSHISKSFGGNVVLDDVSFNVDENEKAAIVGVNGSGKSSLLKIITGELEADSGDVIIGKDVNLGYLAQDREYDSNETVFDEIYAANPEIADLEARMAELSRQMNLGTGLENLIEQYDAARRRFEDLGGYSYKSEAVGVLKGLGFCEEDFNKPVKSLSGGEKTRTALGKMLMRKPDFIILDEPTNHLDLNATRWLEGYLSNYRGAVLLVAHDRYFLDKTASKIIELRQSKSTVYLGNYTDYSIKRQAALDALMKQYLNRQAEIKHQEEVIAKLKSFNREKSIKRAESREKMLDKIERIEKPVEDGAGMRLFFTPKIRSGKDVLNAGGLTKSYGGSVLFSDAGLEIKRGEKVAMIGDNGAGKTTLLKIITGELSPDAGGYVKLGTNVQMAYFDQEHQALHPEKTLFEEIQDAYPDMNNTQVRNTLAAFLFTDDDVFKQIKNLSGGEKSRASLAKLMLSDANFLLLDEPTNHLDIDSKQILENAIKNFDGAVLYVSHDRYFINATATRIIDLTNCRLVNYIGNYDYYLEKRDDVEKASLTGAKNTRETEPDTGGAAAQSENKLNWQRKKEEQARLRKIENEIKKTESEIDRLEARNSEIDSQFADPKIASNSAKLKSLSDERQENEHRLEELMEKWERLNSPL